jgi:hypothetical protein
MLLYKNDFLIHDMLNIMNLTGKVIATIIGLVCVGVTGYLTYLSVISYEEYKYQPYCYEEDALILARYSFKQYADESGQPLASTYAPTFLVNNVTLYLNCTFDFMSREISIIGNLSIGLVHDDNMHLFDVGCKYPVRLLIPYTQDTSRAFMLVRFNNLSCSTRSLTVRVKMVSLVCATITFTLMYCAIFATIGTRKKVIPEYEQQLIQPSGGTVRMVIISDI